LPGRRFKLSVPVSTSWADVNPDSLTSVNAFGGF
jgi:hypothetical protein